MLGLIRAELVRLSSEESALDSQARSISVTSQSMKYIRIDLSSHARPPPSFPLSSAIYVKHIKCNAIILEAITSRDTYISSQTG